MSEFNVEDLSKNLSERVKELECLYKISRIASVNKNNLDKALDLIIKEIPNGWQHPERMAVYLEYGDNVYGTVYNGKRCQQTYLDISKSLQGQLVIYFKDESKIEDWSNYFLPEEQFLLNQIGHEIAVLVEIDERNKREKVINENLINNDRLKLLSEITAGIAHEINTPLNNIIGYSELILKENASGQLYDDLNKVLKSATHAREIVKKLMYFSCEMPSNFKSYSLNRLINECLDLLKIQLTENNVSVNLHLQEELAMVNMDTNQFTQVIFNLILNAIDAMPSGGVITISTASVNRDVRMKISDKGHGMSEEELSKIFSPFYSKKQNNNGTGLGLSVSHGIIQAHGGRIEVDSQIGRGTTFTIVLTKA